MPTLGAGVLDSMLDSTTQETTKPEDSTKRKTTSSEKTRSSKDKTSHRININDACEQNDLRTGGASVAGPKRSADKVKESGCEGTEFDAIHEKFDHLASAMNTMAAVEKELKRGYDAALEEEETFSQDSHDSDPDKQSPRVTKKGESSRVC